MKTTTAFLKRYFLTVKVAALTALAIVLFECVNLGVLYGYVRTDLYVSLAAGCFFALGLLVNKSRRQQNSDAPVPSPEVGELLTARERQIISLLEQGKTNKEIAAIYFIEISTVKTHLNNIYAKLSVKNRKEACAKYALLAKNG